MTPVCSTVWMIFWQFLLLDSKAKGMATAQETPVPAPSAGLVARIAAHLGLTAPVETAPVDASAELADLQSKFDSLQAGFDAATLNALDLSNKVTALTGELEVANATLAAIEALVPNCTTSDPAAAIQAAVVRQSVETVAASGFKVDEAPAVDATAADDKSLSRSDFAKLTPQQQSDFSKSGGKLTE